MCDFDRWIQSVIAKRCMLEPKDVPLVHTFFFDKCQLLNVIYPKEVLIVMIDKLWRLQINKVVTDLYEPYKPYGLDRIKLETRSGDIPVMECVVPYVLIRLSKQKYVPVGRWGNGGFHSRYETITLPYGDIHFVLKNDTKFILKYDFFEIVQAIFNLENDFQLIVYSAACQQMLYMNMNISIEHVF
jgi:hypothetical protein